MIQYAQARLASCAKTGAALDEAYAGQDGLSYAKAALVQNDGVTLHRPNRTLSALAGYADNGNLDLADPIVQGLLRCPRTGALLVDAVVAQDGFAYQLGALQADRAAFAEQLDKPVFVSHEIRRQAYNLAAAMQIGVPAHPIDLTYQRDLLRALAQSTPGGEKSPLLHTMGRLAGDLAARACVTAQVLSDELIKCQTSWMTYPGALYLTGPAVLRGALSGWAGFRAFMCSPLMRAEARFRDAQRFRDAASGVAKISRGALWGGMQIVDYRADPKAYMTACAALVGAHLGCRMMGITGQKRDWIVKGAYFAGRDIGPIAAGMKG